MLPAALESGRRVAGRYEIIRLLGKGGMGEVYAARRATIGDVVALKRLLPERDSALNRRRFATEAQAAAHIRHPNVVQVFDFAEDEDIGTFLVMEHLDGPTLADELRAGRLSIDRALWVFSQVCSAVEAGHRRGIVHRDLKPANVIIAPSDDGGELVKVLDFGLAIDLRAPDRNITTPGTVVGTVSYMSPEQAEGRPATPASDIFALGVILYELVTGALPFTAQTAMATLLAITGGQYRSADYHVPSLPRSLVLAIDAALARDPERRPASAELLARMAEGGTPVPGRTRRATTGSDPYDPETGDTVELVTHPPTITADETGETAPVFGRFIGRTAEMTRLRDEYTAALAGRGRLALVLGEAGVGTSRLAEHFAMWARERGALTLSGRFFDYAGSRPPPLETFVTMLAATGPRGAQAATAAAAALRGEATTATTRDRSEPVLGPVATEAGDRWRAFAAITDSLAGQAAGRPLVILLDDLQWAGRLDLDLIEHLHRTLGPRGTLVVATVRTGAPSELDAWRASRAGAITALHLPPFDEDEVRAWLDAVFRTLRASPVDVRRLARTTGGNPYALAEIARHLIARNVIRREDAGWRCGPLDSVELPDSVTTMVRGRLAELGEHQRPILEMAAVIGDQFRVTTLAAASGLAEDDLDNILDEAAASRLITDRGVDPGDDFRFVNPLIRQVLYDDMPARQRRRAHRAVVAAMRTIHGDRSDRYAHVFAYHFHAIGDAVETVAFGVRAAAEALARHDFDAARAAINRADDAGLRAGFADLGSDANHATIEASIGIGDRVRLDLAAGILAVAEGRYENAEVRLGRAADTASSLGLAAIHAEALRHRARAAFGRGDHRTSAELARQAAEEAEAAGARLTALEARALAATAARRGGAPDPVAIDALIASTTPQDPPTLRARLLRERAYTHLMRGAWTSASDDAAAAIALARAAGDLDVEQMTVALQASIRSEAGDHAGAVDLERQALTLAHRLGDRRREAIAMANLGETLLGADRAAEAVDLLRAALTIFIDIGDRASEGDCRVNVGRALQSLDRHDEARAMLERGIEQCVATGRREYEGIGAMSMGRAHLAAGDVALAREAFARAVTLFHDIGFHLLWQAELGAARAAAADGDLAAARDHAERARDQVAALRTQLASHHDPAALHRAGAEIEALLATLGP